MYRKTAKKLLKFIEKSPTAFQAVTEMTKRLDKEGFESFCDHSFFHSAEACVEVSYYGKPQ